MSTKNKGGIPATLKMRTRNRNKKKQKETTSKILSTTYLKGERSNPKKIPTLFL